ncbi:hypothetical protein HZ994_15385 [Akkermansiaceae bacterium]|nr:hypothetical protein HZ994_15385 [Akkermansiaceae bacterium]
MRITSDIEKPVLECLKRLQKKEKSRWAKIASLLLAEALSRESSRKPSEARLRWISAPMGAKVDLADKAALYREMETPWCPMRTSPQSCGCMG